MDIENIQISEPKTNKQIVFKGFIKESEISYTMVNIDIPFPSVNFLSKSIPNRIIRKIKFSFDVISSDKPECIKNYERLDMLGKFIKPSYIKQIPGTDLYLYDNINTSGLIDIHFNGFVLENNNETIRTIVTNFSYDINKELGFIEHLYGKDGKTLIPIGYSINIEGKISEAPIDNLNITEYY